MMGQMHSGAHQNEPDRLMDQAIRDALKCFGRSDGLIDQAIRDTLKFSHVSLSNLEMFGFL